MNKLFVGLRVQVGRVVGGSRRLMCRLRRRLGVVGGARCSTLFGVLGRVKVWRGIAFGVYGTSFQYICFVVQR